MKTVRIILVAVVLCSANFLLAQNINWRSLDADQTHVINLNGGWDYASTIGIGYGYKLRSEIPIVVDAEFSMPFGSKILDDFKVKLGGQAELVTLWNFSATVKAYGIFRRYENSIARLLDFGSEFSGVLGYYRSKWYTAAEFGFDKAVTTHIQHSTIARERYPEIKDGWYVPTGGNFFYGIQAGYSFETADLYVKFGKTVSQDFKMAALIPLYLQLGINRKF